MRLLDTCFDVFMLADFARHLDALGAVEQLVEDFLEELRLHAE
jgi:hypothetical protein